MRYSAVIIAVGVISLAASLARADMPPPACGPSTCQGCCQAGACVASTAASCGVNGAICVTCQSGNSCIEGICKTSAADGGVTPPRDTDSGCAMGGRNLARVIGPWLLCASFSVLLLLAGRRRRR